MVNEKRNSEPRERKKREVEVRDLGPKKDAKGGTPAGKKDDTKSARRTGEIDFMEGVN